MWVLPSAPRLHSNSHPAFIAGRTQVRTGSFLLSVQKMEKIKLQLVALQDLGINELKTPFLLKGERWTKQSWISPQFCKMQAAEGHLRKPLQLNNSSGEIAQCRKTKAFSYWNIWAGSQRCLQNPTALSPAGSDPAPPSCILNLPWTPIYLCEWLLGS